MTDSGFGDKVVGKAKEVAGDVTGDKSLKVEGLLDQAVGKAKEVATDVSNAVEGVAQKVKDAVDGDPNT